MAFANLERLQNGAAVVLSSAQIVNFSGSGGFYEQVNKLGDIFRVNVIPDLFSLVTKNFVSLILQIAFD